MPKGIEFGLALSDPTERNLATRIFYGLARIEQEMKGHKLVDSAYCDEEGCELTEREFEEKYVLTGLIYDPHHSHVTHIIICMVDDLHDISSEIDRIDNADVKIMLRDWYILLKTDLCKNDEALAYQLNKKRE
jgi:hypothetical protein